MAFRAKNVPKPPGSRDSKTSQVSESSQKRRRASGPTDARQCPNQSSLSSSSFTAPTDNDNLTPSDLLGVEIHPIPTTDGAHMPVAVFTPWLTIREGERYCHVRDGILRAAIKRGDVPAYKRDGGKGVLVHMSDLDAWIRTWNLAKGVFA